VRETGTWKALKSVVNHKKGSKLYDSKVTEREP